MKKVLALVVAFALCFTAIAGCFAVSAAAPVITISSESIAAAGGNATFTISGREYTEKYAQILTVTVEADLEVLTINDLEEYDPAKENDDEFIFDWVRSTDDKGNTVIKILNIIEADATFDYVVNVKAPANTSEEADVVYDITATVEAGKYQEGVIVDVTIPDATFTVEKVAHVCDFVGEYDKDADGHWQTCTCGATNKAAHVPGEAEEVEGFMVVSCTVCGYEISKTEIIPEHVCTYGELQYKVEDGNCITYKSCIDPDCQEEDVVVASIANGSFSHAIVLESGLIIQFIPKTQTIFTTYTNVTATAVKDNYAKNETASTPAEKTTKELSINQEANNGRYYFEFDDLYSFDMCSNVNIKIFGTDANGNKVLVLTEDYSIKTWIDTAYNSYVNNNKKTKADFVCDLASYGEASQLHFKRNIDNLPTAGLNLEAYGTPDLAVSDFNISSTIADGKVIQSGDFNFSRAPILESRISLDVYFPKTNAPAGSYLVVDFKDYENNSDSITYTFDEFATDPSNSSRYQVNFAELRAIELHEKFDITLYAADGSVIATCAYSYDTYAWQATNSASTAASMKTLANRIVCYGRSTRTYFDY